MPDYDADNKAVLDEMLLGDVRVRPGKAFGFPAYYAGAKMFMCVYERGIGLKLTEPRALALIADDAAASEFRPYGKGRMRAWVYIETERPDDYRRYASVFDEAIRVVLSEQEL